MAPFWGRPRVTFETPEAKESERASYGISVAEMLERCTPSSDLALPRSSDCRAPLCDAIQRYRGANGATSAVSNPAASRCGADVIGCLTSHRPKLGRWLRDRCRVVRRELGNNSIIAGFRGAQYVRPGMEITLRVAG
jgi:hypothetical protein